MSEQKQRVLLVDDEPGIVKFVGRRLEFAGFEVITATDGQDGLTKARIGRPDVIILDLMMPKMNGMEMCAALKQDEQTRRIPVIIFTAKGRDMDEKLCRECGADAYITKSQRSSALLEQIEALLGTLLTKRPGPVTDSGASQAA